MNPIISALLAKQQNAKDIRATQRKLKVIKEVYLSNGIAINELMKRLEISFPTLNALLSEMMEEKLIVQTERGESVLGRRPTLYNLTEGLFEVICIEINFKTIKISYIDNRYEILVQDLFDNLDLFHNTQAVERLSEVIDGFIEKHKLFKDSIAGIAIAMPGLINPAEGVNYSYLYNPEINLKTYLQNRYGKAVYFINDSNNITFAEQHFGALQQTENGLTILMDWGMALGIVANGSIITGTNGFAGEMGHIHFIEQGELCYCGKRGCLETVASGLSLIRRVQLDLENDIPTLLRSYENPTHILPIHIIDGALKGDQYAIMLINDLGHNLGKAIALFIQIFNPQKIILTGVFAKADNLIIIPIKQQIQTYAMGQLSKNVDLLISPLTEASITAALSKGLLIDLLNAKISNNSL